MSFSMVSKIHPLNELTNKNKIINFKQAQVTLMFQIDQDDLLLVCSDHHYVHVPPRLRDQAIFQSPKCACDAGESSLPNFE